MKPIKTTRFMVVFLGLVGFGRMCIAGTWIDDFSNLQDWGGDRIAAEFSAAVVNGHFNYRGKKQNAQYRMENWGLGRIKDFSLDLKFMVRNIQVPEESFWLIEYKSFNEETGKYEGLIDFEFRYSAGILVEPNVAFVSINQYVPEEHPQIGQLLRGNTASTALFSYKKEDWYTLTIEREGNQYIFWIGDFGLFVEDDSVPIGSIGLFFHGRCNIWLDDFTVTGPAVQDGGPGILQVNPLSKQLTTTWGMLKR